MHGRAPGLREVAFPCGVSIRLLSEYRPSARILWRAAFSETSVGDASSLRLLHLNQRVVHVNFLDFHKHLFVELCNIGEYLFVV